MFLNRIDDISFWTSKCPFFGSQLSIRKTFFGYALNANRFGFLGVIIQLFYSTQKLLHIKGFWILTVSTLHFGYRLFRAFSLCSISSAFSNHHQWLPLHQKPPNLHRRKIIQRDLPHLQPLSSSSEKQTSCFLSILWCNARRFRLVNLETTSVKNKFLIEDYLE